MSMTLRGKELGTGGPAPAWADQSSQNDPEKLKATLKDANTSSEQFSHALGRLQEVLGQKVYKNTASDEEKELYKLLNDLFTGKSSDSDTEKLGSLLGVDQGKLSEVKDKHDSTTDDRAIK